MKILGIIPARAGSKRLKNKNILKIKNKPLIAWSILTAKKSKIFDKLIVSTDSKKIAKISKKYGAEVPFLRPSKISGDNSKSSELILHAINFYKNKKIIFDYIILIEPTSPLREVKDFIDCLNFIKKNKIKSLVTISKVKSQHPRFLFKLSSRKKIKPYLNSWKNTHVRTQDVEDLYFLEGSLYCSEVKTFIKNKTFYHKNTSAIIVPDWKAFEIDNYLDYKITECVMKNKKIKSNG